MFWWLKGIVSANLALLIIVIHGLVALAYFS
jgi:hypothetical protein